MALTDIKARNAKPCLKPDSTVTTKPYRLTDEKGLYLEVAVKGSKWWRFKYRFEGKEKRLSLGVYPDVSLKQARDRRDAYRKQVADGIDPSDIRKAEKVSDAGQDSFEFVAREWHSKFSANWTKDHAERTLTRIKNDAFPWIGNKNINDITSNRSLTTVTYMNELNLHVKLILFLKAVSNSKRTVDSLIKENSYHFVRLVRISRDKARHYPKSVAIFKYNRIMPYLDAGLYL